MGTFFALQPMDTLTFDVDMNAAVIEESPMPQGYQICRSDDIPSYQVFLPTAFLENCTFRSSNTCLTANEFGDPWYKRPAH